jgi:hypothetical protein
VQPYSIRPSTGPALFLLLVSCALVALAYGGCGLDTAGKPGHRIDQPTVVVDTPAKDDDAGMMLRAESTFCAVTQMQVWVNANYPSGFGWSRSYSGNNGTATLVTGSCNPGSTTRVEHFNAGSCGASSCTYDVQRCDNGCAVAGCYHDYTLKCTCAPNQCTVSHP